MRKWELARELTHITLCFLAVLVHTTLGLIMGSALTALLLAVYTLNELARNRGVQTPLTVLYRRILVEDEVEGFAKSPLYLGLVTLILMNTLPLNQASASLIVAGLVDGFAGFIRSLKGERENLQWRVETALAGFTLAVSAGVLYTEPYSVVVVCLASVLVEALIIHVDDNLTVPLFSGLAFYLVDVTGLSSLLMSLVETLDLAVYVFFSQLKPTWLMNPFMMLDYLLPAIYLLLALYTVRWKGWRGAAIVLALLAVSTLLVQGMKPFFGRPRPPYTVKLGYSFPSNHAAFAGVAAGYYIKAPRRLSVQAYLLSAITVAEILLLGSHWASDIIAGFLLSLLMALPIREL